MAKLRRWTQRVEGRSPKRINPAKSEAHEKLIR